MSLKKLENNIFPKTYLICFTTEYKQVAAVSIKFNVVMKFWVAKPKPSLPVQILSC